MLDEFLATVLVGAAYTHVRGFELGGASRARRDARYNTTQRIGSYPPIDS